MDSFRENEVKFSFIYEDVNELISHANDILKKNESKPSIYQDYFFNCTEKIETLDLLKMNFEKCSILKDSSEVLIEKIKRLIKQLYEIIDKLVIFLQKGCEENDQTCLEYIEESEQVLINMCFKIISN
jgi:hypothetical protein